MSTGHPHICSTHTWGFAFLTKYKMQTHLNVLKHIWVVADLPQLHDSVHKRFSTSFPLSKMYNEKNGIRN